MRSRWLFLAFLSPESLGAFFLPSLPSLSVADNVRNSRVQGSEAVSHANYGLHKADFAATRNCFDGATHDLSVVVPFAEVQKKKQQQ